MVSQISTKHNNTDNIMSNTDNNNYYNVMSSIHINNFMHYMLQLSKILRLWLACIICNSLQLPYYGTNCKAKRTNQFTVSSSWFVSGFCICCMIAMSVAESVSTCIHNYIEYKMNTAPLDSIITQPLLRIMISLIEDSKFTLIIEHHYQPANSQYLQLLKNHDGKCNIYPANVLSPLTSQTV